MGTAQIMEKLMTFGLDKYKYKIQIQAKTIAYYGVRRLLIRNVFIVLAPSFLS
jgi:hypothetical protein